MQSLVECLEFITNPYSYGPCHVIQSRPIPQYFNACCQRSIYDDNQSVFPVDACCTYFETLWISNYMSVSRFLHFQPKEPFLGNACTIIAIIQTIIVPASACYQQHQLNTFLQSLFAYSQQRVYGNDALYAFLDISKKPTFILVIEYCPGQEIEWWRMYMDTSIFTSFIVPITQNFRNVNIVYLFVCSPWKLVRILTFKTGFFLLYVSTARKK